MTAKNCKIVLLGGGGVGKSALTIQLIKNEFLNEKEYDPTIEDFYRKQAVVDKEVAVLDILDTAGQEEYAVLRDQYIRTGQGFLLVYSVGSRESFEEMAGLQTQIMRVKDDENIPIVVVGNKCDLGEKEREVSKKEGSEFCKSVGCSFFETSAKNRVNVEESFFELVRQMRKYDANHNNNSNSNSNKNVSAPKKRRSKDVDEAKKATDSSSTGTRRKKNAFYSKIISSLSSPFRRQRNAAR